MRSKEEAADYRYFADPDLPLIVIEEKEIALVKGGLPELPHQRFERYLKLGLSAYEAEILLNEFALATFYEEAAKHTQSKQLINFILRDFMGLLKTEKQEVHESRITPVMLASLVTMLDTGAINNRAAQEIFHDHGTDRNHPEAIMKEKGLQQMGNIAELEEIIKALIAANPDSVAEYKAGKERLWGFFVGQAMQKTKGRGNPQLINDLLKKYLS